ncbi:prickle-like protein 4 isoform X2 [Camelus dromedarius]|uniref:prickle-like protein 4 isoform X2 n=1 Tax=Camelus dromedarius TaxID=9838 RepID=UPI003119EFEA
MSLLNSGCPHQGERLTLLEPNPPPVNSDSHPGHMPAEDPEETSALVCPENLSLGSPGLDTKQAPSWPGLRTLLQQLPPQDSDERYCLALGEEELAELRLFCAQRRREALGQGVARLVPPKLEECICEKCREQLRPGEYGVFAARAGEQRCWHRACFACQACGQTLINLIYFYHDGRLYCGRHHAELLRPRCPACDQLIFSRRCTQAEGRRWHENHFCCQDCAGPLGGGRYALPGGGPCCPSCFESRYSNAGSSPAPMLEGRASPGKGGKGAKGRRAAAWAGLRRGFSRAGTLAPVPRRPAPPAAAPSPHRTPRPEPWGPQLSPRVPGRSAPRASRTHPTPQLGLRRGLAGAAAALWWAEEGRGKRTRRGGGGGAHGPGAGQEAGPRLGLASRGGPTGVWEEETQVLDERF